MNQLSKPARIARPDMPRLHVKAVDWVSALVLDLKLQLIGRQPHNPITMERLDEWHRLHAPDLDACRHGGLKR